MVLTILPFEVLALSAAVAAFIEGLSWLLVYRTASYRRLTIELERANNKLTTAKAEASAASTAGKKQEKQEKRLEDTVKGLARDLNGSRMKANLLFSATMLLSYQLVTRLFAGQAVARLPFEPPSWMRRMTHAGLEGEDWYEASAMFVFISSCVLFRTTLQKAAGWAPPRVSVASPFAVDEKKLK